MQLKDIVTDIQNGQVRVEGVQGTLECIEVNFDQDEMTIKTGIAATQTPAGWVKLADPPNWIIRMDDYDVAYGPEAAAILEPRPHRDGPKIVIFPKKHSHILPAGVLASPPALVQTAFEREVPAKDAVA